MSKKNKGQEESIAGSFHSKKKLFVWQAISAVLFLALIITALFAATSKSTMTGNMILTKPATVDQKVVADIVSLLKEGFNLPDIETKDVKIEDGLYNITISLEDQEMPIYATLSGEGLIIPGMGFITKKEILDQKKQAEEEEKAQEKVNVAENYSINTESTLSDFLGKPSVIFFVGTYCGHCQSMVPEVKTKLWKDYKDKANIWVNVIDGKKFVVDDIAQGLNNSLDFTEITGKDCGYIPSFVVLDASGKVTLSSCGSEKTLDNIKTELDNLLK